MVINAWETIHHNIPSLSPGRMVYNGNTPGVSVFLEPWENSRLKLHVVLAVQGEPSVAVSSEEPELIMNIWHPASHPSSQQD